MLKLAYESVSLCSTREVHETFELYEQNCDINDFPYNELPYNDFEDYYVSEQDIIDLLLFNDNYTFGHSTRVMSYAFNLGLYLNLPTKDLYILRMSAIFHDIGKIHVPPVVLNKKEKLTVNEFELIKEHSLQGANIIRDSKILHKKIIQNIIVQHHERLDGSGFPYGLKGKDITLEARIIAIVDTFDAMTTDRPYKKKVSTRQAIDELKQLSESKLDNFLVEQFILSLKA